MAEEPRAWQNRVLLRELDESELSDYFGNTMLVVPESLKYRQKYRQWVIEDIGPDCSQDLLLMEGLRVIINSRVGNDFYYKDRLYKVVFDHQIQAVFG